MSIKHGILYVVATPIGNLEDFSARARRVLSEVDFIVAEDSRHSRRLLSHHRIATPVKAYHDHNERRMAPALVDKLLQGAAMALISDAGMPLISDPGYHLVRAAHRASIPVVSIPGPCSVVSALSIAGLPVDRFVFEGYLPKTSLARQQRLKLLQNERRTMVFFEAPHRMLGCLRDMIDYFGPERIAAIAREMTKKYESMYRGTLGALFEWLKQDAKRRKGEFVVMVEGAREIAEPSDDAERVLAVLLKALPLKQAVSLAGEITRLKKNDLYTLALALKRGAGAH
ncbi:MAG: 16S rRNA (cytidine(1402)-2'-O)-methyltransferase [Gammaproteobacteria bacterium]|nr:16S rRNA (cytidine(1402)-2'-O)-methyltransferase [Gammaproteobacteria bacterium]